MLFKVMARSTDETSCCCSISGDAPVICERAVQIPHMPPYDTGVGHVYREGQRAFIPLVKITGLGEPASQARPHTAPPGS